MTMCPDINFLKDAVLPFITQFIGVLLAGAIAFLVARWQIGKQEAAQKIKDEVYLEQLYDRVRLELRDNKNLVEKRLAETAELSGNSYDQHWAYLVAIAKSFKFTAYHSLLNSGLLKNLPKEVQIAINSAYDYLETLQNFVFMGESGQAYHKWVNQNSDSKQLLKNVQTYTRTVISGLDHDFNIVVKKNPYSLRH